MTDEACDRCGAFGDIPHGWVEGDCILPHRNHSTGLVSGAQVCEHCVERWRDWLGEVLDLYADLAKVVLTGSLPDEDTGEYQKPQKAPASPSPLRLAAWALFYNDVNDHIDELVIDEDGSRWIEHRSAYLGGNLPNIPAVLTGWAQVVHDALYEASTAPHTVSGAVAVLRASAATVARDEHVDDFDAELRWVRSALRSAHGISNPDPLGNCMVVNCRGMVWPVRGERPRCDRCNRRYDVHDIVRLHAQQRHAS